MLLIKNAKIYTMTDEVIDNGDILIENGKIKEIGKNIDAENVEIIDANGLIALPGLVDAHSHIGGMNFSQVESIDDFNEMTKPLTPEVQALYGTDITSPDFEYAYKSGTTTICLTPGSGNVINGWVYAAKTYGDNIFDMVIKNPTALKIAFGGNPKGTYGKRDQMPSTRMSIPSLIRDIFERTKEYIKEKEEAEKNNTPMPKYNSELEAIIPVIKKEIPLKMHCTQFDMITAIEIAKEYDMKFSLEHAWGAKLYLDEIEESGCDICFGPLGSMIGPGECSVIDIESVVDLDKRGINTSIITDSPILSVDSLIQHAGEAVRSGLPVERALKMITINAAKIIGVEDRVGSLEVGKDGDVVLFKGMPTYETNAKVMYTIVEGKVVYKA
ncbi:MAG: amidohydrolase family protein [Tissierellia bacterium]|nr:amidohydrolase family protein [Tissierellia bacterium]